MPDGPSLSGLVLFVRDLDRSGAFYRGLLGLEEVLREPEALLLTSDSGSHIYLRLMESAVRASASIGVQDSIWTMGNHEELVRAEQWLRAHDALVARHEYEGVVAVEGRDPDHLPVLVGHPAWTGTHPSQIFARVYQF